MARTDPLHVWLFDRRVAELTSRGPGEIRCRYTEEALDTWPANTPLLSCSLPLSARVLQAGPFFRGMLPEGQHLQALADVARVPTFDTFGLLTRFGRDVAGAAIISASDPSERTAGVDVYESAQLQAEVEGLETRPLGIYDDSELSIAGLQNKLLLVETPEGWARPVSGYPSTHILKVEDRRFPSLVTMEAACLRLARHVGLTDVDAVVQSFSGIDCLIVSRFDRVVTPHGVDRVHQEDACQALGLDAEAHEGAGKYERGGGPSFADVAAILDRHASDPTGELERLVEVATFTTLIANSDAHGKNISVLHAEPTEVSAAPLYDTVPTALWPTLPDRAAMRINGQERLSTVTLDDVVGEARRWPLGERLARRAALRTMDRVAAAVAELDLPDQLSELITARAEALVR